VKKIPSGTLSNGLKQLTLEVVKGDLLELVVPPGLTGEGRGGSADNSFGGLHFLLKLEI
jgi:hypothetical protein